MISYFSKPVFKFSKGTPGDVSLRGETSAKYRQVLNIQITEIWQGLSMVSLTIKADFKDLQKRLKSIPENIQKKVIPAALNKVVAKANTEMVRGITSEFNIKASEVRENLRVTKARSVGGNWVASLDPNVKARRGRGFNLIRFAEKKVSLAEGRRRKKAGTQNDLRFQIKKGSSGKVIKGAFLGNNGRTVFARIGKERLPIKALTTIDVPQMFNTKRISKRVIDRINAEMIIEFDRAINLQLSKAGK